jgi:hypothetical protein
MLFLERPIVESNGILLYHGSGDKRLTNIKLKTRNKSLG